MSFSRLGALGRGLGRLGGGIGSSSNTPAIRLSASSLAENSAQGTAIGTLSVVNATGTAAFTLVNSASNKIQLSGTNNVSVQAGTSAANYETATSFTFIVSVSGVTPSISNATFRVDVTDVNEFTPVITSNGGGASASVNAAENQTAVTTVTATDGDGSAVITYSITGGADSAKFAINSTTGVLTFVTAPDYEAPTDANTDNAYVVIVQASDGTNTDTQTITVTVTDVVDTDVTAPTITSSATQTVAENSAFNLTLTADESVTWTKTGGADTALFTLVGSTLSMSAKDYEIPTDADADNAYVVQVTATDAALNATNQTITVTVTNVGEGGGTAGEAIGLLLTLTKAA